MTSASTAACSPTWWRGRSPAAVGGVRAGDVIVHFEGAPVGGIDELQRLLTEERVGCKSDVQAIRRSQIVKLEVIPVGASSRR